MSFAGSVGTLMGGSGLSESLESVYGPVSVKHMLTGKAIAMFLRGNFLVESALTTKLLSNFIPFESKLCDTSISTEEIERNHELIWSNFSKSTDFTDN